MNECYEILNRNNFPHDDIFISTFKYPFSDVGNFSSIKKISPMLFDVKNNIIKKLNGENFFSYITKINYFNGLVFNGNGFPGEDGNWELICELKVDNFIFYGYYSSHCCYTGFEACGSHMFYVSTDLKNLVFYALEDCVREAIINKYNSPKEEEKDEDEKIFDFTQNELRAYLAEEIENYLDENNIRDQKIFHFSQGELRMCVSEEIKKYLDSVKIDE